MGGYRLWWGTNIVRSGGEASDTTQSKSVGCLHVASLVPLFSSCLPEDTGVPVDMVKMLPHSQLQALGQFPDPHVLPHFFHLGILGSSLKRRDGSKFLGR